MTYYTRPGSKHPTWIKEEYLKALSLMAEGCTMKGAAIRLNTGKDAIQYRLMQARIALDAHNTAHAIAIAIRNNLI